MENLQEAVANAGYETSGYTGYYSSGFGGYGTGEPLPCLLPVSGSHLCAAVTSVKDCTSQTSPRLHASTADLREVSKLWEGARCGRQENALHSCLCAQALSVMAA